MIYSGLSVLLFVCLHLSDFALSSQADSQELGLYGLVWNSFLLDQHPWRPVLYVAIVCLLGLHLSHGVQSVDHTFGLYSDRFAGAINGDIGMDQIYVLWRKRKGLESMVT